ncbi:MAG: class I SAM-dependent methyltransferase [Microscillaceae bacterium]
MAEELKACPLCAHPYFKPWLQVPDYAISQETFSLVQCKECGFCFTNPRPAPAEIGFYYASEEYISHSNRRRGLFSQLYQWVRQKALVEKKALIHQQTGFQPEQAMRLLDYGCGTGEFLYTMHRAGWRAYGVEPAQIARQQAIQLTGLPIYPNLWQAPFEEKKYDVITLWHVLEHVHALLQTMAQLRKLLRPGGAMLLALPNRAAEEAAVFGKYWAAYDVPRHLYHFDSWDVQKLALRFDLRLVQTFPMYYDAYYVSLLSEKYRSGYLNYWAGLQQGWLSNRNAGRSGHYSSLIYWLVAR